MKHLILVLSICSTMIAAAQSGITWGASTSIATSTYSNMHPRITLDASGSPMVIWGRMNDESVFFSRWNGTAFATPVKLNPAGMTVATASWMGPDIASKGDTVYVVVRQTPESMDTSKHIFILSSFNGGTSFSAPVRVDHIGDSVTRFPAVTIDGSGNPIVAFMKFDNMFMNSRWAVTKSADLGATFGTDTKASGWSGPTSSVCDCCPGTVISAGNTCAMLYRDNLSNLREIWAGISTNNASSFSSGFTADTTNFMINSCPASGPDGVVIGDTVYSVFFGAASGADRTYLSKSSLSTGAVQSVTRLKGEFSGLSQQNYPRIATDGRAMAIVWKQTASGNAQMPILFTNNIADTLSYGILAPGNVSNGDVAILNGKVYAVWQDDNSGTVKIATGTYTPYVDHTGISDIRDNALVIYPNPTSGILNIHTPIQGECLFSIFNALGEKLYSAPFVSDAHIETSAFAVGIYAVRLTASQKTFVSKFTKE
ncbi:MAG: hypothetical protein JWO03_2966 [Bacteroidetes bacterium]|nr:hypothetical protein [Bacteroidota bacterium]